MQLHKWLIALLGTVVFMIGSVVPIMGAEEADPTKEQFIPMPTYLTGPFAAGGSGNSGGTIDYFNLLNMRINTWGSQFSETVPADLISNVEHMIFGGLIIFFLIVEPHGLARLWQIAKEKLRLWPFPY